MFQLFQYRYILESSVSRSEQNSGTLLKPTKCCCNALMFYCKPSVDVGISGLQGSKTGKQCSVSYCFAVIFRHGLLPVGQSLSCGIACSFK